jgi:ADP-ribose pyrophosphatase YjhB (NUDIX family)
MDAPASIVPGDASGDTAGAAPGVAPGDVTASDLIRWAEALSGIARTGLGFTQNQYERERYEEVLHVAADMRVAAGHELRLEELRHEWMRSVGSGVPGYVTPKVAVGAVVGDEKGRILLVQRSDSLMWLYPTGWADIGYSPAEVAVKEVREEAGIDCEPVQVLGVFDGMRMGFTQIPLYSILFHCRAIGGELQGHPLETADVGWFHRDALPTDTIGASRWAERAFAAIDGAVLPTTFDAPREPVWRGALEHDEHPR